MAQTRHILESPYWVPGFKSQLHSQFWLSANVYPTRQEVVGQDFESLPLMWETWTGFPASSFRWSHCWHVGSEHVEIKKVTMWSKVISPVVRKPVAQISVPGSISVYNSWLQQLTNAWHSGVMAQIMLHSWNPTRRPLLSSWAHGFWPVHSWSLSKVGRKTQ